MAPDRRGLAIPFTRMGAVTSDDLFEPREQAIFDFYERAGARYGRAADVGANIGIHTILMAQQGWMVRAFEPDPVHFAQLEANVAAHGMSDLVDAQPWAISTRRGTAELVRVLGNTTANHLAGARGFHGPVERLTVVTHPCQELFRWADFAKVDCEGLEAELLCTVRPGERCEFMVEIGTRANAERIWRHFEALGRAMWSQKIGWGRATCLEDLPQHYTEGSLFIGEDRP